MPNASGSIRVPARGADEPAAEAEQLRRIRQLVSGMSLHGYRFDYRKLGRDQAQAVLTQLIELRNQGAYDMDDATGPGFIGRLLRRLAKAATIIVVLCLIGAGVYVFVLNGDPMGFYAQLMGDDQRDLVEEEQDPAQGEGGLTVDYPDDENLVDSKLFHGLKVYRDPIAGQADRAADDADGGGEAGNIGDGSVVEGTDTATRPTGPAISRSDLDALRSMLAKLRQFTRSDYPQSIRAQSVTGMQTRLEQYAQTLAAIEARDASLADGVRRVVAAYGEAQVDGQAMRDTIGQLLERLDRLQ